MLGSLEIDATPWGMQCAAQRHEATFAVKADLALRALAAAEGLEATEAEVDAELERRAGRMEVDRGQLRRQLEQEDAMATVRSDVLKAKAFDWLLEHVEVVDEAGQPIDRADLSPAPEAAQSEAAPEYVSQAEQAAEEGDDEE